MSNAKNGQSGVENGWVVVGALRGAHGVRGDVKIKSFTAVADDIFNFPSLRLGPVGPVVKPIFKHRSKDGFVASIAEIRTREEAEAKARTELFAAREDFEALEDPDEFYYSDLVDLSVKNPSGQKLGCVRAVENFGAEDLVEITLDEPIKGLGRHVYVPFRQEFVTAIDLDGGILEVDLQKWQDSQLVASGDDKNEIRESDKNPEKGVPTGD